MGRIKECQVKVLTGHRLKAVGEGCIELIRMEDGAVIMEEVDYVALAMGVRADEKQEGRFRKLFPDLRCIGDAQASGNIADAVKTGFIKAYGFEG